MGRKLGPPSRTGHTAKRLDSYTRTLTCDRQKPDFTDWYLLPFQQEQSEVRDNYQQFNPFKTDAQTSCPQKTVSGRPPWTAVFARRHEYQALASPVHVHSLKTDIPSVSFSDGVSITKS